MSNLYKKIIPYSVITLSCMLLSSCFGNITKDTFELSNSNFSTGENRDIKDNIKIIINEPISLKILNSENIIIRSSPIEMRYLIDSQWSDRLPRMIQSKLISKFENNQKILTVSRTNQGIYSGYQLSSNIQSFEINIDQNQAVILMSIKIINLNTGDIVAQKVFHAEEPFLKDNKLYFVQSLDIAFNRMSTEIVKWTLSSILSQMPITK
ncbi:ABC-type transport auxiliary lipoprotein family protein [Candidatus Liberibacter americanus]|uniref:ABC-type transport auxiliary lipoprotein family protein n=1 Tax=Candidatus Liberibacter americanus TaxID=309868 RepID=UPI0003466496|nr:ABC-type transport auxiliary lipoprotein family protein [Candidatus Liberibacter americanus]